MLHQLYFIFIMWWCFFNKIFIKWHSFVLQTSVCNAGLSSQFADYWQDNSRQAGCSWNYIQTLEGRIHRFRGLLYKQNTQHFLLRQAFCFILKILSLYFGVAASNISHGRLTVYLLQCFQSLTNFNDVKEVNWFSMSFNSASLDSVKTFS